MAAISRAVYFPFSDGDLNQNPNKTPTLCRRVRKSLFALFDALSNSLAWTLSVRSTILRVKFCVLNL